MVAECPSEMEIEAERLFEMSVVAGELYERGTRAEKRLVIEGQHG